MTPLCLMLLVLVSGCAPLPPPAPAVVESVTIRPMNTWATLSEGECLRIGQLYGVDRDGTPIRCRPHPELVQEIARDQAQQADYTSMWVAGLTLSVVFSLAFLWAIRAWPWKR